MDNQKEAIERQNLIKYYETLVDLFVHPGWKLFVEDISKATEALNTLDGITSERELFLNQGKLTQLRHILSYENQVNESLDQMLHPDVSEQDEFYH